jgi:uncharacterized membrane protein
MAVTFGLIAALCWGLGDFLSRFSARGLGAWRSTFFGQMPGAVVISLWLLLDTANWPRLSAASPSVWVLACLGASFSIFSTYAMTRALMVGVLSLVVPIIASYGAISTVLALLSGETLAVLPALGIAICIGGIAAAAAAPRNDAALRRETAGIGWALAAAAGYGTALWIQGRFVMPRLGPAAPLTITYCGNVAIALVFLRARRESLAWPPLRLLGFTFGYGVLTATAYISLALGLATGQVAIVAVLSSLCSALTAVLGFILLRERMAVRQWAGVALILLGVGLVNAG